MSAIFVPGLIAAFHNRFAALLLYLWFASFRPLDWLWVDLTSLHLSLWLGLFLLLPCLFTGVFPYLSHPVAASTMAFLVLAAVGLPFAVAPDITWVWVDYLGRLVLVSLLAIRLITTRDRLLATTAVVAASLGFHTAKAGLLFLLKGGLRFSDGLYGSFVDNNGYALATTMIIFLLFATGQNVRPRWLRVALFTFAGLSIFTVVGTYSRAGFVGLLLSALMFALLQPHRGVAFTAFVVCVPITIAFAPLPTDYLSRLDTILHYEDAGDTSAISRPHFWRVAFDMALDRPWIGVGLKGYEPAYDRYDFLRGLYGHARSVHSSHFQVLAELGFPGLLLWVYLFAYAYLVLFRVRARSRHASLTPMDSRYFFTMANGMIASITAFLVGGSFIALALNDLTWLTFALVVALDRLSSKALPSRRATDGPVTLAHPPDRSAFAPRPGTPKTRLAPGPVPRQPHHRRQPKPDLPVPGVGLRRCPS